VLRSGCCVVMESRKEVRNATFLLPGLYIGPKSNNLRYLDF
jgi:hypothetical protein